MLEEHEGHSQALDLSPTEILLRRSCRHLVAFLVLANDIDAWWERAIAAGVEVVMPISEMFWGAQYGQVRDPFGVLWSFNQPQG